MKFALALQFGPVELSAIGLAHVRHGSRGPHFQLNEHVPATQNRQERTDTLQPIWKYEEEKSPRCDPDPCQSAPNDGPSEQPFFQLFRLFPKLTRCDLKWIRTKFLPKNLQIIGQIITSHGFLLHEIGGS